MRGQVLLLAVAQALFQTASTLVVTVGGLAGAQIARTPGLATAPIASMFLGTTIATVPASLWMAARGRRTGFVGGALVGALGGLVAAAGIVLDSLLVLSLGTLLVGAYQGVAQFYRFAAAEVADEAFRSRAISLVLAGGVAAALLGPALGKWGAILLEPMYAGSFLLLALTSLVAAGLLLGVRVPMRKPDESAGEPRRLSVILRQPTYAVARFGILRIMSVGLLLLAGHITLSLAVRGFAAFASALVLLGVGWNFLYVGGTTLLTESYFPAERGRAQAANDLFVFLIGLMSSLSAGPMLQVFGWRIMNAIMLPWLLVAAFALVWLGHARARSATDGARR